MALFLEEMESNLIFPPMNPNMAIYFTQGACVNFKVSMVNITRNDGSAHGRFMI